MKPAHFLFPLLGVLLVNLGFWLSGFDYDKRGNTAVGLFLMSLFGAVVGFFCTPFIIGFKKCKR
jgi:hypothetical protein